MPGLLSGVWLGATAAVFALLCRPLGLARAALVAFASTFIVVSGVGLLLLNRGQLQLVPLTWTVVGGLGLALVAALGARRVMPSRASPPRSSLGLPLACALVAVVGLGVGLRLSPSPYLHGGQDQGIYVNVGHHIARTGRLRPVDRLMAGELEGLDVDALLASHKIVAQPPGSPLEGVREGRWLAGIHVEDASEGRLVPGFFHLLPVWFAMAELDWGFDRSTWPLVYFWLISGLALFGLAWRLAAAVLGPQASPAWSASLASLAVLGLALHPLDLWISTFTVTENLARACLLGAALLAVEGFTLDAEGRREGPWLAALAGLMFGAAAFTRGSFVAHAIALAPALIVLPTAAGRARRALLVSLVAATTLAVCQAVLHSWPYFFSAASNHFHVPRLRPEQDVAVTWTLAAGAAVLVVDVVLRRVVDLDGPRAKLWLGRGLRVVAGLMLVVAGLAVVLHGVANPDGFGSSQQVLTVLGRYVGPVGLGLACVGLVLGLREAEGLGLVGLWLAALIVVTSALKSGIRYEFYYARYLVADLVPVVVLAATAGLALGVRACLGGAWAGRRRAPMVVLVLAAAWLAPPLRVLARPVYWTRDLHDTPAQLRELFAHVPDDAVLFFDARAPGRWRGILAVPALLSFDRQVLVYPNSRVVEAAIKRGVEFYFVSGGWETSDVQRWPSTEHGPFRTRVVARGTYLAERAEVVEGGMPEVLVDWGGPWEVQRVDPSIWRGTGAFTLFPGSDYATGSGSTLETAVLDSSWPAHARVELGLLAADDPCAYTASLVRNTEDETEMEFGLAPIPAPRSTLRYFAMPDPRHAGPGRLRVRARCPAARPGQELAWAHLSMRWDPVQPDSAQ